MVTIVACTSLDPGWVNHVALTGPTGLDKPALAITEQVRTLSRDRIVDVAGLVDHACLGTLTEWVLGDLKRLATSSAWRARSS